MSGFYATLVLPGGDEVAWETPAVPTREGDLVVVDGVRYAVSQEPAWYLDRHPDGRITGGPLIYLSAVPR